MEITEYNDRLKQLKEEFEKNKKNLIQECALSNNPYNIGDIITDQLGTIQINAILFTTHYDKPTCVYIGTELKKDLTPKKGSPKRQSWQINIVHK